MTIYVAPFIGSGVVLTSPTADGAANTPIITDGSGALSFGQAIGTGSSPQFVSVDLTALTTNYLPYDNNGALADSPICVVGGKVGINEPSPGNDVHIKAANLSVKLEGTTDDALLILESGTDGGGNEAATVRMRTNGSNIWYFGKNSSEQFVLYDYTGSRFAINVSSNGDMLLMQSGGNVGVGTTSFGAAAAKTLTLADGTAPGALANTSSIVSLSGELWAYDAGANGTQLTSHPKDAPQELYELGPGKDWIGKQVWSYEGRIIWTKPGKTPVIETFAEYNRRLANEPGHVDLTKRDAAAENAELEKAWHSELEEYRIQIAKWKRLPAPLRDEMPDVPERPTLIPEAA